MRQPTPESVIYAWWRAALADPRTPRHEGEPQPGFYARRAVKGGPLLPVRIWMEQDIDPETGELASDEVIRAEELGCARSPTSIWTHCRPIPREEYEALVERHRTDARMAATHAAFDVSETPMRPGGTSHA